MPNTILYHSVDVTKFDRKYTRVALYRCLINGSVLVHKKVTGATIKL
jgi:hypothetical protein